MAYRLSIARKLAIAFAIGPLVLAGIGAVAYFNTSRLQDTALEVERTYAVREAGEALLAELLDAETGQRGYLLTGIEAYRDPYRDAVARIDGDVNALAALVTDDRHRQDQVAALRPLVAAKLAELAQTIQTRGDKGFDAALDMVRAGQGKKTMDQIRAVIGALNDETAGLLKNRKAAAESTARMTFGTILLGTLASFVLLAGLGYAITRSITGPVRGAVNALASSTAEILAGTAQQASGAQEQAAAAAETATTVDEIAQTAQQASLRVKSVADASQRAVEVGDAGRQAVEETITMMGRVQEQSQSIAQSILGLAEQAQAIGEIIAVVNDIAEQTNLLALNAAIEASRVGEHGRGFTVVASEIKALAEQSKKATGQVRQILGEIQRATNGAVVATEQGTKSVGDAIRSANQAGLTITSLVETVAASAEAAVQVTASAGQQAIGMAQIQQAVQNINQATSQNLASTRQAERAAHDLDSLGGRLRALVVGAA